MKNMNLRAVFKCKYFEKSKESSQRVSRQRGITTLYLCVKRGSLFCQEDQLMSRVFDL